MSSDSATIPETSFWSRQFGQERTWAQICFDLVVGAMLPVACLAADPIVFRGDSFGAPRFGSYALFAYAFIGIAILALAVSLLPNGSNALLAGVFVADTLFALLLGFAILPYSILGVFFVCIGLLGLSPFLTAFVFGRNAIRAWKNARHTTRTSVMLAAMGFVFASAGPFFFQRFVDQEITRATELAVSTDEHEAVQGVSRLRSLSFIANSDNLVWAYRAERDSDRRDRLARAFKELTGEEIEHRLRRLLD
jgi:hypothetical protein